MLKCYSVLTILSVFCLASCHGNRSRNTNYSYAMPQQLDDGIAVANIATVGLDSNRIITLTKLILADTFTNIHSLLIVRNNKLVYENYFSGKDENWGSDLGYTDHNVNALHDVRSISKSIVSACIGIAIMQHRIKSADDPIFNYLPEYVQFKTAFNEKITIRHLLTMSSGIRWDEDVPHNTSGNNESQMEKSNDPVAYTLRLPADQTPGKYWNYNSGGVQVLAAIIRTVSGDNIDKFAEHYLFTPLGIRNYEWIKSQPDFPAAASGLRLSSRDLLKIGLVYMNEGKWNDKPIIAEDWAKQSLVTNILRTTGSETKGYGYLFWTNTDTVNQKPF